VRASARIIFTLSASTFSTTTGHFLARPWISSSFLLPEPSRPQGTAGRSSALTARVQATRASTGWHALWTKRLEALLPTPWKTSTLRNLGLVQGACATAA
jgi:hypothetical protein